MVIRRKTAILTTVSDRHTLSLSFNRIPPPVLLLFSAEEKRGTNLSLSIKYNPNINHYKETKK